MLEPAPDPEPTPPPLLRRVAYRLRLRRLPPEYRAWVVADLQRPGAEARSATTAAVALGLWWWAYVVLFALPTSTFGWMVLLLGFVLVLVTRPTAWRNIEASILRTHGVLTVDSMGGLRQGAGQWVDGLWYCDEHGNRFCRECSQR